MRNHSLKILFFFALYLFFLIPLSWSNQECGVSLILHPAQHDTLKVHDKWLAWDKVEHLGVSTLLSGMFYNVFHDFYYNNRESSTYFSASFSFAFGLGKELYDKKKPEGRFSYKDLVADAMGIGLGLWIATR